MISEENFLGFNRNHMHKSRQRRQSCLNTGLNVQHLTKTNLLPTIITINMSEV